MSLPYVETGTLLFRFLDHRTDHFWATLQDILVEKKLFLNSRSQFNDPYDSHPDIQDDASEAAIKSHAAEMFETPWREERSPTEVAKIFELKARSLTHLTGRHIQNIKAGIKRSANEFLDQAGIISFSLTADHPLLWAHYAAGSTGICVVFRRGTSLRSAFSVCTEVSYVDRRPCLSLNLFLELVHAGRTKQPTDDIADEIFRVSFLHKATEWSYEREARIYYPFFASKKISFDENELYSFIVGPRASADLEARLRAEIANHAPRIPIIRASLSETGFGIIVPKELVAPPVRAA